MTCTKHHPANHPGEGICALCLQEKLGNLVSSSLPIAPNITPSSTRTFGHSISTNHRKLPPRIPFLSNKNHNTNTTSLQRSKSTAATSFPNGQRRSFWSFLYSSSSSSKRSVGGSSETTPSVATRASSVNNQSTPTMVIVEDVDNDDDEDEANSPPTDRHTHTVMSNKVSRSRSVGCGGRSFSGDFFERLGDCTIRRVESQRQSSVAAAGGGEGVDRREQHKGIKERVRCGGSKGIGSMNNGLSTTTTGERVHGRSRNWAWALASPLRAFVKPTSIANNNRLTPSVLST